MPLFRRRRPVGPTSVPYDPTFGDPEARTVRSAMLARDWLAARAVLERATDQEALAFLAAVTAGAPAIDDWFPDVLRAEPDAVLPLLVHGERMIVSAWEARSGQRAKDVSTDQFEVFFRRLRLAEDCLQSIVRRDPGNAVAWAQLITTARGLQLGKDESWRRFNQAVAADPGHLGAHQAMLQNLCAKWGGSNEEMFDFARSSFAAAQPGSLLGYLIPAAHFERMLDESKDRLNYIKSRDVRAEIQAAADRSIRHADYRDRPSRAIVRNTFAAVFSLADEDRAAAELFRVIGDMPSQFPWTYYGDAGKVFGATRSAVYRKVPR